MAFASLALPGIRPRTLEEEVDMPVFSIQAIHLSRFIGSDLERIRKPS
jgi:hypothetical protein